ncbi:hypothetical protein A1D22_08885 [Pasteurellaceae bacterium LFhippo2]|nr:hypothetical protein [Pasteurellaceae bacterium LFhippo2]
MTIGKIIKKLFYKNQDAIDIILKSKSPDKPYLESLYKLGLFQSICILKEFKLSYEYIVSLFAIGNIRDAKILLEEYQSTAEFNRNKNKLILGLLPFNANASHEILSKKKSTNILLENNLLAALGKNTELSFNLSNLSYKDKKRYPEFHLLKNNICDNNEDKLCNINYYLSHYQLDNIIKLDDKSPFVTNIKCEVNNTYISNALISILVTTHNSADFISSVLESLINQTYSNREIIIVDDKSSDNTVEIIKQFTKKYSFIQLIQLDKNVGTYVAKTIGEKYSKGEFVICHDSDDWAHPRKLELQVDPLLKNPNLVVSFSKWIRIDANGCPYARSVSPLTRLNPSSALFRRKEVKEKTGLWHLVRTGADSEFNARLKIVFKDHFVTINKPLTIGSHRNNSLMTASDTGYSSGKSLVRLNYWEAWNYWHIHCIKNNHPLYMDKYTLLPNIPAEIAINPELIQKYI